MFLLELILFPIFENISVGAGHVIEKAFIKYNTSFYGAFRKAI